MSEKKEREGLGLATAFRIITIIPVWGPDCSKVGKALPWFPVVGLALGGCAALTAYIWQALMPAHADITLYSLLGGGLIAALWAYLTRGFHLDGFSDMFDGFGGGWTRERSLEIMKDSRVGAFGAIALALLLIVKTCALGNILVKGEFYWLISAPVLSRLMMVMAAAFNRYARETGTGGAVINEAGFGHFLAASFAAAVCLAVSVPYCRMSGAGVCLAAAMAAAGIVCWRSRKHIGGITGDILGAVCESAETCALIAAIFV
ncbi:MAG: adenosylcobinamide-GDP ribazoletransferase [bacterium]|nr:adenosylcobinamide-GDP ribazoletransferase [bacterium]